jgi:hypothetical protein
MKKEIMEFILSIMDKTYKFLSKLKCSFCCCNSTCVVDKSVHNCPEEEENERHIRELRKNKSESSLDSLKNK